MNLRPVLQTRRLTLRLFRRDDAPRLAELAGRREISHTMISIPHPCTEAWAREWIARKLSEFAAGLTVPWAMELRCTESLVGGIQLRSIDHEHALGEVSFWIGCDWWGQGLATEALQAVLAYGFGALQLNRIYGYHMVRNPASGRVLEKAGFQAEGVLRQRVRKWGVFEDVVIRAILREDWMRLARATASSHSPPC